VLAELLSSQTRCVLELGSWLGSSTRFIADHAPNAVIICVDLWDNNFIKEQQGDHYLKNPLQVRGLACYSVTRRRVPCVSR
jgi:hypothetical protein